MTAVAIDAEQDRLYLRRALDLAELGRGRVSPNPLVGAVVVRDGVVIGEGYHAELGGPHAEVAALADCSARGLDPVGSTMYVTLEPCAHHGRTPPCAEAVLAAGISRVLIASDDPSDKASGRGPGILRDGGVEVSFAEGAEASAARLLNQPFRKHARTGRPLVRLKVATSLDGRVATASGDSKWISSEPSRELVHRWRAESDAICVGIGTVLADDPLLTARGPDSPRQPKRVVFDSRARLPLDSQLVGSTDTSPVIVAASTDAPADRVAGLRERGVEVIRCDGDLLARTGSTLGELGRLGITSLFLEGGPALAGSFLEAGEIDELRLFVAPLLIGGDGIPWITGAGAETIADATRSLSFESEPSGDDLLIRARLREW